MAYITDAQVRKLMEEFSKHGQVGMAALRAGMDRKTARRYLRDGALPSQIRKPRTWRTRTDPFEADWLWIEGLLGTSPELEAKTIFDALLERKPGRYQPGQIRTLQRRLKQWRALHGPEKTVFFAQEHRPGEAIQVDFTWATGLRVTITGEELDHMFCHAVLPYSNWEWATICQSESLMALTDGLQSALFRLGRRPRFCQTDNTTAATHNLQTGKRDFNEGYEALMRHLGMEPRTIAIGAKEQNGDVEAIHRALKNRLDQALLLRGSREFDSLAEYEGWLCGQLESINRHREARLREELRMMAVLQISRLPACKEEQVRVTTWSTIRVMRNTYSVPSRLIGERVTVRVHERKLEVFHGGHLQLEIDRLRGVHGACINYRHVIWSLVQKPGAFARYRFRDEMFPSVIFRRAYDDISKTSPDVKGDLEYLRILYLAATTMEADVEAALCLLLDGTQAVTADAVKKLCANREAASIPEIPPFSVELAGYDQLLSAEACQ